MSIDFSKAADDLVSDYKESLENDPYLIENFNDFKRAMESLAGSQKDVLLWGVFISFMGSVNSLDLSEGSANVIDDLEARVSFIEKDMKNLKRFLKRLEKGRGK